MRKKAPRTAVALGVGILAVSVALTGCTGSTGTKTASGASTVSQAKIDTAMKTPTTLTFWTWVPNIQTEVALFEKKYPAIKVNVENVGQGAADYQKLRTALKAGKGAPDVAQIEYQYIPSFTVTNNLSDLSSYGASKLSSQYVPWVWNQVKRGNAIYGIPQDSGPMGNLYRADILKKAGVTTAPATWADYATTAAQVRAKTGSYMSDLASNDAGQFLGLLWQAGVKPFGYDGKKGVSVAVNTAAAKKVATYWQTMIQKGDVATDPDFTNAWYEGLANGKYAGWITAAWGPVFLQGTAGKTSGLWRASALPQTSAGQSASGNWGGSSDAVLKTSTHQIAAYELSKFINNDPASTLDLANKQFLFPTSTSTLTEGAFTGQAAPFYGGQKVNSLFAGVSKTVDTKFQWLPYMDYAYSSYNETVGKALANKGDLSAGLDAWQKDLTTYGAQQGFTVSK
jgi:multiple sugar transport system substrate-binding protein